jgi:hypothetical protein
MNLTISFPECSIALSTPLSSTSLWNMRTVRFELLSDISLSKQLMNFENINIIRVPVRAVEQKMKS